MTLAAAVPQYIVPSTFTSTTERSASGSSSHGSAKCVTPALFTRPSTRPNADAHSSTSAVATDGSVTDPVCATASPPASTIEAATSAAFSTSFTTTRAPDAAACRAYASPNPRPAPVTITALPSRIPTSTSDNRRSSRPRATGRAKPAR